MKHKGFTVVELIIIIVVIAILASITMVSYSFMQEDAADVKIRSVVKNVGDALSLYEMHNGSFPVGTGLLNEFNGVDSLLIPKYLKSNYRQGITSKRVSSTDEIVQWFTCSDGGGGIVVYASLNNPSSEDQALFNQARSRCGPGAHWSLAGMNYAQFF